jgi:hypothetical protein
MAVAPGPQDIDTITEVPLPSTSTESEAQETIEAGQNEAETFDPNFRVHSFAQRKILAQWFPQIDDEEEKS